MSLASYRPLRVKGAVFLCVVCAIVLNGCAPVATVNPSLDGDLLSLVSRSGTLPKSIEEKNATDQIANYYTDVAKREGVIRFFASLTKSESVALAILENSVAQKVPASLAFAIAYEESRFNPKAFNKNASSVDRGLFQLNSTTFPELSDSQAFDPAFNAREGLGYFRHVLEIAGNEVSALAMYNAGRTRVSQKGAPVTTLDYISRILTYEKNIHSLFTAEVVAKPSLLASLRFGLISGSMKAR